MSDIYVVSSSLSLEPSRWIQFFFVFVAARFRSLSDVQVRIIFTSRCDEWRGQTVCSVKCTAVLSYVHSIDRLNVGSHRVWCRFVEFLRMVYHTMCNCTSQLL